VAQGTGFVGRLCSKHDLACYAAEVDA